MRKKVWEEKEGNGKNEVYYGFVSFDSIDCNLWDPRMKKDYPCLKDKNETKENDQKNT